MHNSESTESNIYMLSNSGQAGICCSGACPACFPWMARRSRRLTGRQRQASAACCARACCAPAALRACSALGCLLLVRWHALLTWPTLSRTVRLPSSFTHGCKKSSELWKRRYLRVYKCWTEAALFLTMAFAVGCMIADSLLRRAAQACADVLHVSKLLDIVWMWVMPMVPKSSSWPLEQQGGCPL